MYCCQTAEPGYLPEPYHLPGYSGHIPSMTSRYGGTFGRLSRVALEDPCVAQAPVPILQPPQCPCPRPEDNMGNSGSGGFYCRNPVGCEDMGCYSPALCPVPRPPPQKKTCTPPPLPCNPECCDPRAHHLNRSPYACPCKPETDANIYRCCEPMGSSYSGHVPGFTFHSNGRTFGRATWGTKQYMQNCFYFNTFAK